MKSLLAFSTTVLFTLLFCVQPGAAQSDGGGGSVSSAEAAGQTAPVPAASTQDMSTTESMKKKKVGMTMITTGWLIFGGSWQLMIINGISRLSANIGCVDNGNSCESANAEAGWLFAPLVGPLVTASMAMKEYGADVWWAWLEVLSDIFQIGGLAVAIAGHVIWSRAKAAEKGTVKGGVALRVIPMFHASRGVVGLSLAFSL